MADPENSEESGISSTERSQAANRSTWVSVVMNLALTVTQIVTGVLTHSQALVADGIHSLSDLVSDGVVLLANKESQKDADDNHPYGHQRFENGASLLLGILLLLVGVSILVSAIGKLQSPQAIAKVHVVALWVALGTLVAKECLFRYMLAVATHVKSSMLVANAWHARSDAASSLIVAMGIGGNLLGYPILDPISAFVVGLLIARMGWQFGWNALHDLMDRAVDDDEVQSIRETLLSTPGVKGVHDLRTRKMGDMIIVDVHLEVPAEMNVEQAHDICVIAHRQVLKRHRVLDVMTHIDPWKCPDLDHTLLRH